MSQEIAVIAGVGPGLGWALARRFARAGMRVVAVARNTDKLKRLADAPSDLELRQCDVAEPAEVGELFARVIIDGQIESERYRDLLRERGEASLLPPDEIAEAYFQLHRQNRGAWTHELDLRPWVEKF